MQACLKFASEPLNDLEKACEKVLWSGVVDTKIKLFDTFAGREMLNMVQGKPSTQSSMEVETLRFRLLFH